MLYHEEPMTKRTRRQQQQKRMTTSRSRRREFAVAPLMFVPWLIISVDILLHVDAFIVKPTPKSPTPLVKRVSELGSVSIEPMANFPTMSSSIPSFFDSGAGAARRTALASDSVKIGGDNASPDFDWTTNQKQQQQASSPLSKNWIKNWNLGLNMTAIMEEMGMAEMVIMSTSGVVLSVVVVSVLAVSLDNPETAALLPESSASASSSPAAVSPLEIVVDNVVDAAVPLTASDAVSVALGEGLAGLFSAGLAYSLAQMRRVYMESRRKMNSLQGVPTPSDAVADADFFITQAAVLPLLQAVGLSTVTATVASILLAVLPSEFIKFEARQKQRRIEEEQMMKQLLFQQQADETKPFSLSALYHEFFHDSVAVDPESLRPVRDDSLGIDLVELVSDILKWLGFALLMANYGGPLEEAMNGVLPQAKAWESGAIGSLATLSTQLYADILYAYFGLGGLKKKQAVRSRSSLDWFLIYFTKMLYGAVLFGVYEWAQAPATDLVNTLLFSDACFESPDFDMCVETFSANQPMASSPGEQFGALLTALRDLSNRILFGK